MPTEGRSAHPSSSSLWPVRFSTPKARSSCQSVLRSRGWGAARHMPCRVFILPRLLPGTVSRAPGLDQLWSERREDCRAHRGGQGPVYLASRKDARYISAPACSASAPIDSSCVTVLSPWCWNPWELAAAREGAPGPGPWYTMVLGLLSCIQDLDPSDKPGVLGPRGQMVARGHCHAWRFMGGDRQPFPEPAPAHGCVVLAFVLKNPLLTGRLAFPSSLRDKQITRPHCAHCPRDQPACLGAPVGLMDRGAVEMGVDQGDKEGIAGGWAHFQSQTGYLLGHFL